MHDLVQHVVCWCRYGVPCNVGDSKMRYDLVVKTYYWIAIVVSNTRLTALPPADCNGPPA